MPEAKTRSTAAANASKAPIHVLQVLSRIRLTIRRRLIIYGLCAVASGGCLSILTIIALDWLLELPPWLRVIGAVLFLIGFGIAVLHWIVRPLQKPLTLAQVAGRLEQHYPRLNDRLSSTVSFLTKDPHASDEFTRRVVANTNRVLMRLKPQSALTLKPLIRQGVILLASLIAMTLIATATPQWIATGFRRYVRPFNEVQWPRRVDLVSLSGDLKIPYGESVTLRMHVTRGADPFLRGVVHLLDADGRKTILAMHREPGDHFRCTVDAIASDTVYYFEAGDNSTWQARNTITVASRPTFTSVSATIAPPQYARSSAVRRVDLRQRPASAVLGSTVTISVVPSKPIGTDTRNRALGWLQLPSGQEHRLSISETAPASGGSGRELQATFPVRDDILFRINLVDRDGFQNRDTRTFRILATADRPPSIARHEPRSGINVTPTGKIRLLAEIGDDFGITALELIINTTQSPQPILIPLLSNARRDSNIRRSALPSGQAGISYVLDYNVVVDTLDLDPPAVLNCRIRATDNCPLFDQTGQSAVSDLFKIHIITESQFESRIRDTFSHLQQNIRRILLDQIQLLDLTEEHIAGHSTSTTAPDRRIQRAQPNDLARQQSKLAVRLERVAARFADLGNTILQSGSTSARSTIRQIEQQRTALLEIARNPQTRAADELDRFASADSGDKSRLARAIEHERDAVVALREQLKSMEIWQDFEAVMAAARNLLDRQQSVHQQTIAAGATTLGKRTEELSVADHRKIRQLHRSQQHLGDEVETLLKLMRDRVAGASVEDTAGVDAIESALRTAIAQDIAQRMSDASDAISQNRIAGAGIEQRAAEQILSEMLAHLQKRHMRHLAQLARRYERALDAVSRLHDQQKQLLTATDEIQSVQADPRVLLDQVSSQNRLRGNTEQLARDFFDNPETAGAADTLRDATTPMSDAERFLQAADAINAARHQGDALDLLNQAVLWLQARANVNAHAAFQQRMADIRRALHALRTDQSAIRDAIAEVASVVRKTNRLNRSTARKIAGLTKKQRMVRKQTSTIRDDLKDTIVFKTILQEVAESMTRSADALRDRRLDDDLTTHQTRILDDLDRLLRALDELIAMPPSDAFSEGNSGGGSGSGQQAGNAPPVPPAAELLMIKLLQSELLTETRIIYSHRTDNSDPTESELRAIDALAQQQRSIRRMADTIIRKSRKDR